MRADALALPSASMTAKDAAALYSSSRRISSFRNALRAVSTKIASAIRRSGRQEQCISYIQNFVGGTNYIKNRVAFSAAESGNVIPGNWIQVQPGKGITGGMSQISSVTRYVDSPIYDNDPLAVTGTVTGFKGYQEYLVANLSDNSAIIELGSNSSFNVFVIHLINILPSSYT